MNHVAQHRNKQVLAFLNLVTPIARHYSRRSRQDHDDLLQVGRLGLLKAAQQFDTKLGSNFEAFAKAHIRGAILHYLRDRAGLVRLPRRLQEQAQSLLRQRDCHERANRLPLTAQQSLVVNAYRQQMQLTEYDEDSHPTQTMQPGGLQGITQREQATLLASCWRQLPLHERACVYAVVVEGSSLRTTAKRMGTSAMTVQRRVKHGLQTLASECHQRGLKV